MRPEDRPFVANGWLKSYEHSREGGAFSRDTYWQTFTPIVDGLLDRAQVTVYCNPDDHWQVLGWACWDENALHYVYTKTAFRDNKYPEGKKPGLAMELVGDIVKQPFTYTFSTLAWRRYMQKHRIYNGEFNPRKRERDG